MSNKNTSSNKPKSDWGDEVMPGIYMIGGMRASPFSHPALAAPMEGMDLAQIYEKIDECEDLIQKLVSSNQELLDFFLPKKDISSDDDDDDESDSSNSDDNDKEDENHVDPNDENNNSDASGGGATSMEALLAMAEQEAQQYLSSDDDDDDAASNKKKKKKSKKKKTSSSALTHQLQKEEDIPPSKEIMDQLPKDIQDAILENIQIIKDNRSQQKELLEFTAVRQHKCGCHRIHGKAANDTEPQEMVAEGPAAVDNNDDDEKEVEGVEN